MNSNWKIVMLASGSAILCGIALKYLKLSDYWKSKKSNEDFNEVLLYGNEDDVNRKESIGTQNLFTISYVVCHAKHTVDVCLPQMTSSTIIHCLIYTANKGITVRVIIHRNDNTQQSMSYLKYFKDSRVMIKIIEPKEKLEHEFILVDVSNESVEENGVGLIGALNYSYGNVNCQLDSTLVTSEMEILLKFRKEFDRIWNHYKETQLLYSIYLDEDDMYSD